MELQYKNNEEELFSFYKYNNNKEKILKKYRYFKTILMIPISLVISILILFTKLDLIEIQGQATPEDMLIIVAPIFFGVIWSILYHLISKILDKDKFEAIIKNMDLNFEEEITLRVTEEGLTYLIESSEAIYYWNAIKEVIERNELIYIVFNNNRGIVIPVGAFTPEKDKLGFLEEINKRKKA